MLREIANVRQTQGEGVKRWFTSSDLDLFVWFNPTLEIISFHLVYDKQRAEKAVIWNKLGTLFHFSVDDGSRPGRYPSSPILTEEMPLDRVSLATLLRSQAHNIDPAITDFLILKIESVN